ncbi:helix-turn-helix domain-containing protein [Brachybacterium massiliense]|uniref:helix-turn-helix transcriptional regulator n=1 Tax=Brachybacterium massiliense TaxID=1755098 RepID=UPI001BB07A74
MTRVSHMTISYQPGTIPQWTIADRLRKAREMTGMDQSQFAEHAGLSRQGVNAAERGQSTPRRSTLKLWALSTGVPISWIETGEAPSPGGDGASSVARPEGFEPPTF